MERITGTVVRGLRAPIIKQGDDIVALAVEAVMTASRQEGFSVGERDIVAVTESVVARAQGNYATVDDIARDVSAKFGDATVGVVFPILSRNRFAVCLRGIARGARRVVLMLSYPADEVGNHLVDLDELDAAGVNPWNDVLTEAEFRRLFGHKPHPFTGVDYVDYYKSLVQEAGVPCDLLFSNDPRSILAHTDSVLACDIHSRERTKRLLKAAGARLVFGLDDILSAPGAAGGYNPDYGLLGSNKATETSVKLFPRDARAVVDGIQKRLFELTGKTVEALVYGDGAFKDPVGKIWELADPVVSPAHTAGLDGLPNELKIKYLADNEYAALTGQALKEAIAQRIRSKPGALTGAMEAQGTTPRRLADLVGSLCDLSSGSGDKGTPVVYIQGYFDNYAS